MLEWMRFRVRGAVADGLARDVHYAVRQLTRNAGFAAAAVLPLALALGVTTGTFSVVSAVLFHPLPYRDPGRLVRVSEVNRPHGAERHAVPLQSLLEWRARSTAFELLAGYEAAAGPLFLGSEIGEVPVASVTPEIFDVLDVRPLIGAIPLDERSILISHRCWCTRFGQKPTIVGTLVGPSDDRRTIAGVMPERFDFPGAIDVWRVLVFRDPVPRQRALQTLIVIGRLRPGVPFPQARAELETIGRQLEREYPATHRDWRPVLAPLHDDIVGPSRSPLLALSALVGALLLLACVNLSSLLLARATERTREFVVRDALGASRWQIVRQVLVETLTIAVAACALGFGLARSSVGAMLALAPGIVARQHEVSVDWRIFLFALLVTCVAAFGCGLAPALRLVASGAGGSVRRAARVGRVRLRTHRALDLLVVSEIALAFVLLVGAGLAIVSFARLRQVAPGFRPERLVAVRLGHTVSRWHTMRTRLLASPPPGMALDTDGTIDNREVHNVWNRDLLERVLSIPGVERAAIASRVPFMSAWLDEQPFFAEPESARAGSALSRATRGGSGTTQPRRPLGERFYAVIEPVSRDYFRTLDIPLRRGRFFTVDDRPDSLPVAIVNETLARRLWPGSSAIGKVVTTEEAHGRIPCEVVGVVADVRVASVASPSTLGIYRPSEQCPTMGVLMLRSTLDLAQLGAPLRKQIEAARFDLREVVTMPDVIDRSIAKPRFTTTMLALFGGLGLVLAMSGVYSTLAFVVRQRRHELAVRVALGARPGDLVRLMLVKGMLLAAAGVAVGVGAAVALSRGVRSLLFGVSAADPATLCLVSLLLGVVVLAAGYLPGRRAGRTDPIAVLRAE
jgi:putative ABC transport system permease protein